jgi:hypothetical protein
VSNCPEKAEAPEAGADGVKMGAEHRRNWSAAKRKPRLAIEIAEGAIEQHLVEQRPIGGRRAVAGYELKVTDAGCHASRRSDDAP